MYVCVCVCGEEKGLAGMGGEEGVAGTHRDEVLVEDGLRWDVYND